MLQLRLKNLQQNAKFSGILWQILAKKYDNTNDDDPDGGGEAYIGICVRYPQILS